jgi:two-component system, LuxR family, response regulator FixJ
MGDGTVFIVDDDEAVRDSLKILLESYGLEVRDFESIEAFSRGRRVTGRACLILDQHLAGATGLDFLASADGARLDLPVILITGQGDGGIRARARRLGVSAYLEKPIADTDLLAAIERAIEGAPTVTGTYGC